MFSFLRKLNTISLEMMIVFFIFQACSSSTADTAEMISIPFDLSQKNENSLDLLAVSNITVFVTGCISGYQTVTTVSSGGTVNIPNKDKNCLVELISFTLNSNNYSASGSNAVSFTTWLVNDTAIFQNTSNASDLYTLTVKTQVTQSGVLTSDTVSYIATVIASTTTSSLPQGSIVYSDSVSVTGDAAPNITILQPRVLSANANGSFNVSFTLQCGAAVTGTTPNFACSGVAMNTRFDYIFIADAYSQSPLTITQLVAAFAANTPTSVGSLVVGVNGTDLNSNTVPNGGFYTSNASPLVTGTTPVYPSSAPNYVLMVRQKDASSNVQSFTYFYIDYPANTNSVTASTCSNTTFLGGAGTAANPYEVTDSTTLAHVALCPSGTFFLQMNSIALSGTWTPIALAGQYNGNGFTISGLTVSTASAASVDGLFSTIASTAAVNDLVISSPSVTSQGINVGTLAGSSAGVITNVLVTGGTITHTFSQANSGTSAVGGLIGTMTGGSITGSSSTASISATESAVTTGNTYNLGGLVGSTSLPAITSSFATGAVAITAASVTARTVNMGNFVGLATGTGSMSQNYSTGNLTFPTGGTGTTLTMGMVGKFAPTSGSISYSFVKGTFSPSSWSGINIGGMVGTLTSPGTVNNSYTMVTFSTGATTTGTLGGFVGTQSAANLVSLSYSADPSFTTSITTKAGFNGSANAVTSSYYYSGATGVPTDSSGATAEATQTLMQTQGTFSAFTFSAHAVGGTATSWIMPTTNTFSSPSAFLSPVFVWQCGANGIVCP